MEFVILKQVVVIIATGRSRFYDGSLPGFWCRVFRDQNVRPRELSLTRRREGPCRLNFNGVFFPHGKATSPPGVAGRPLAFNIVISFLASSATRDYDGPPLMISSCARETPKNCFAKKLQEGSHTKAERKANLHSTTNVRETKETERTVSNARVFWLQVWYGSVCNCF